MQTLRDLSLLSQETRDVTSPHQHNGLDTLSRATQLASPITVLVHVHTLSLATQSADSANTARLEHYVNAPYVHRRSERLGAHTSSPIIVLSTY